MLVLTLGMKRITSSMTGVYFCRDPYSDSSSIRESSNWTAIIVCNSPHAQPSMIEQWQIKGGGGGGGVLWGSKGPSFCSLNNRKWVWFGLKWACFRKLMKRTLVRVLMT